MIDPRRTTVKALLDEWAEEAGQAKNILNCLVGYLIEDPVWVNENISQVDRELLVKLAVQLERKAR